LKKKINKVSHFFYRSGRSFTRKLGSEVSKMILIFGTKRKFKNLGTLENCHCSRCNNTSDWNFMEYRDWFTLFWIPVFPISGRKEYLECPICHQAYEVPKN